MPRISKRAKQNTNYTQQEKQTLLTGVPLNPTSTRFGWPFEPYCWNVPAIRLAWWELRPELLELWETPFFDHYRDRGIFAERFLADLDR